MRVRSMVGYAPWHLLISLQLRVARLEFGNTENNQQRGKFEVNLKQTARCVAVRVVYVCFRRCHKADGKLARLEAERELPGPTCQIRA